MFISVTLKVFLNFYIMCIRKKSHIYLFVRFSVFITFVFVCAVFLLRSDVNLSIFFYIATLKYMCQVRNIAVSVFVASASVSCWSSVFLTFYCFRLIVDVFPSILVLNPNLFSLIKFMTSEKRNTTVIYVHTIFLCCIY